jgi:hypothetical protein
MVLDFYGVPTAPFAVVPRYGGLTGVEAVAKSPHRDALKYPMFIKPTCECNGHGERIFFVDAIDSRY